jgi:hypothetical protein
MAAICTTICRADRAPSARRDLAQAAEQDARPAVGVRMVYRE